MSYFERDGDMYDYILESGDAIRHILENSKDILEEAVSYYIRNDHDIEQIYMIGSGTSYHASYAARRMMEDILGIKVFSCYPLYFADQEKIFNNKTLVIGSSHAGLSSSTISGLDHAKALGLKTIASTAVHGSEITHHGDATIYCEVGPENAGPKTKGYLGAIATHVLFALEIADRKGILTGSKKTEYIERLLKSADNISKLAKSTSAWYEDVKEELIKSRRIVIVGYDNNVATYMEGSLKILEAVRYSVTGYELEEFMHGIYHSIYDDTFMFYIAPQGKYHDRILRLKQYFEERTTHNFIFTSDTTLSDGKNFICDFTDDPDFSCLEYIVPLQVIARKLSADLGIDCNRGSDPEFHRKMGSYRL